MRRLIAVAVLAVCIAAACVTGTWAVEETGQAVGVPLGEALAAAARGDAAAARTSAQAAQVAFVAREGRVACFVHHDLVEELGARLAALPDLAAPETLAEFASEVESARVMLIHIVKDESLSLRGVF